MSQTQIKHLDSLSVVQIDFNIWSGQTRLRPEDFNLGVGGELPSEKVAQLGSKKIIDTANLNGFHRLKQEARRMLSRYGMPFMNGFAVPLDKTDEVCDRLDKIEDEFNLLKQKFFQEYNDAINDWARENPDLEKAIRDGALSQSDVESRIGFEYQLFRIAPMDDQANSERLTRKVNSLGDDLLSEIIKTASEFYTERLLGNRQVNISTRRTLIALRDKIDGLSFLNNAFSSLVQLLDETIDGYAKHAVGRNITDPFLWQVIGAVLILSDRDRIEQYATGTVTVDAMGNLAKAKDGSISATHSWNFPVDAVMHEQSMSAGLDNNADNFSSDQTTSTGDVDPEVNDVGNQQASSNSEDLLSEIDAFFNQSIGKPVETSSPEPVSSGQPVHPFVQPEESSRAPMMAKPSDCASVDNFFF